MSIFLTALISVLAGFFLARALSGEEPGVKGRFGVLRIKVKDYVVHLHHWLYGGFLIIGFHRFFETHPWPHQIIFYSFLAGVVVQGLTYRDFYRIVYKEPDSAVNMSDGENGGDDFLMEY